MDRTLEIRRVRSGEERTVHQAAVLFDTPPDEESVLAFLANPDNLLLLAYLEDQPAGFVRAHILQTLDTPDRQLFLYEISVDSSFRHRGVGRGLIEALKRLCHTEGWGEMFVITNASNSAAMALYAKTGGQREAQDDVVLVYDFSASAYRKDEKTTLGSP